MANPLPFEEVADGEADTGGASFVLVEALLAVDFASAFDAVSAGLSAAGGFVFSTGFPIGFVAAASFAPSVGGFGAEASAAPLLAVAFFADVLAFVAGDDLVMDLAVGFDFAEDLAAASGVAFEAVVASSVDFLVGFLSAGEEESVMFC